MIKIELEKRQKDEIGFLQLKDDAFATVTNGEYCTDIIYKTDNHLCIVWHNQEAYSIDDSELHDLRCIPFSVGESITFIQE